MMPVAPPSPHPPILPPPPQPHAPVSFPRLVSPYTSSVETLMNRLMVPHMRDASSSTWVPYVLFMVKARLLPNELSTCVCQQQGTQAVGRASGSTRPGVRSICTASWGFQPSPIQGWPGTQHPASAATYLGCKVHDRVDLLSLKHEAHEVHGLDVALDKLRVRSIPVRSQDHSCTAPLVRVYS